MIERILKFFDCKYCEAYKEVIKTYKEVDRKNQITIETSFDSFDKMKAALIHYEVENVKLRELLRVSREYQNSPEGN